jgi:hypothetical protein
MHIESKSFADFRIICEHQKTERRLHKDPEIDPKHRFLFGLCAISISFRNLAKFPEVTDQFFAWP